MPHNALVTRIRGEYLEMPGLRLTLEQAQRLCGVERTLCKRRDALVEAKFLCVDRRSVCAVINGVLVASKSRPRAERRVVMASNFARTETVMWSPYQPPFTVILWRT
jgi:hypothetical protein